MMMWSIILLKDSYLFKIAKKKKKKKKKEVKLTMVHYKDSIISPCCECLVSYN